MINNYPIINIYEKKNVNSKISSQILYGEEFTIKKKFKNWFKIRTNKDKYLGYIKNRKFFKKLKTTHKVASLKAAIYRKPHKGSKTKRYLSFASKIRVLKKKNKFSKFENFWVQNKDIVKKNKKINFLKNVQIFKGTKYKWGGKTYKGIDCSALVQIFFYFNNSFCPRDTKDQINYFKKKTNFKKNALIFWKGHVAICLSREDLIHAYGPRKKVLKMNILKTIKLIKKTAKLDIIGIRQC